LFDAVMIFSHPYIIIVIASAAIGPSRKDNL